LFLGLIIFAAMIGNLIIAGFFGFMIPLILKKFNLDPAVSSSIFLTTATDVGGFFIFLGLAKLFLPYLL
jgi:magnesium transporter